MAWRWYSSCILEWSGLGAFTSILLPLIHLLLKGPGLLLIRKRETSKAIFELKRMEKGAVLIVDEVFVNLLVPYYASIGRLSKD